MKKFQLRMTALFLCLVMALAAAGCSQAGDKDDDARATTASEEEEEELDEEEDEEEDEDEEEPSESSETSESSDPTEDFFASSATDIVSSFTYSEIFQQCDEAGMDVIGMGEYMPDSDHMVNGFFAMQLPGGDSVTGFDGYSDADYDMYADALAEELEALQEYIDTGVIPEGYEDLFGSLTQEDLDALAEFDLDELDIDDSEYFDFENDDDSDYLLNDQVVSIYCIQFDSYESALEYAQGDTFSGIVVRETDNGAVIGGSVEESGIVTVVDGAISEDGLFYMEMTTGQG